MKTFWVDMADLKSDKEKVKKPLATVAQVLYKQDHDQEVEKLQERIKDLEVQIKYGERNR